MHVSLPYEVKIQRLKGKSSRIEEILLLAEMRLIRCPAMQALLLVHPEKIVRRSTRIYKFLGNLR